MPTVSEIADRLGGKLEGDGSLKIAGAAGLRSARSGEISFLFNSRYAGAMEETSADAVVVERAWAGKRNVGAVIRVGDVNAALEEVLRWFSPEPVKPARGIHPTAVISPGAVLGADVAVGPYCVIEANTSIGDRSSIWAGSYVGAGSTLGADCLVYPNVTIREGTRIGDRAIVHSGTVIGSDGYGFVPEEKDGRLSIRKIQQIGTVEIGNDVEIGANVTIDRARFGRTLIGNNVKIDNLVQIAHNVVIGDYCGIVAQVGIAGSTAIGSRVVLWGQAGVAGHLTIGDGAVVGAKATVLKDVDPGSHVSGYPAMPHDKATRSHANVMRLPQLKERVKQLEARVKQLEETHGVKTKRGIPGRLR